MPSPPATQYKTMATTRFVHVKDQNAATACTWNHTSTRQVMTLSLSYRDLVNGGRTLSMHAPLDPDGHTYGTEERSCRVSDFRNTSAHQGGAGREVHDLAHFSCRPPY